MRATLVLALALASAIALAGCSARGGGAPDYFAYTKKALYDGSFDLAGGADQQSFFVEDGSIARIQAYVWVNATAGGASVTFTDARHREVWTTSATGAQSLPVDLGQWTLSVTPEAGSAGSVSVLVVRGK